jgi:hypothetical protein
MTDYISLICIGTIALADYDLQRRAFDRASPFR